MRKTMTTVMASLVSAAMIMVNTFPAYAADNIISSESSTRSADVAVTATVASNCELLRLIEVGASCFNHHCVGHDDT